MTDMSLHIAPKSDQLNSDDLIGRELTIKITKVAANPASAEQPIAVSFDGDGGKPYMPCKSMRRVMVNVWGPNGNEYVGRSLTLYRDDKVMFGGLAVGGIRISHMSDITAPVTMALTATRANRKPFTVRPLAVAKTEKPEKPPTQDKAAIGSAKLTERFNAANTRAEYLAIVDDAEARKQLEWLQAKRDDLYAGVAVAQQLAWTRTEPAKTPPTDEDAGFPGDAAGEPELPPVEIAGSRYASA